MLGQHGVITVPTPLAREPLTAEAEAPREPDSDPPTLPAGDPGGGGGGGGGEEKLPEGTLPAAMLPDGALPLMADGLAEAPSTGVTLSLPPRLALVSDPVPIPEGLALSDPLRLDPEGLAMLPDEALLADRAWLPEDAQPLPDPCAQQEMA